MITTLEVYFCSFLKWLGLLGFSIVCLAGHKVYGAELLWSENSSRAGPDFLHQSTLSGDAYIFIGDDAGVTRVEFFLDSPTSGAPLWVETIAPFDFAGTAASLAFANPFNTASMPNGVHTLSAVVYFGADSQQSLSAEFIVNNDGPEQPEPWNLNFSYLANRSAASNLNGALVSGPLYVFVEPAANITRVEFFLDAYDGTPNQIETLPPYDFAGGTAAAANPLNSNELSDGPHTVFAEVFHESGMTLLQADFFVQNIAQDLMLSNSNIVFNSVAGGPAPAPQVVNLTTTNGAQTTFTVEENASWLSVAGGGTTPASLTFTVVDTNLAPGIYSEQVTLAAPGFSSAVLSVEFELTSASESEYSLVWSNSNTRSGFGPLDGGVIADPAHIFVIPEAGITSVEFYLNDIAGDPVAIEQVPPFDFAGTAANTALTALPWNLQGVQAGVNTIYALIQTSGGESEWISADFNVEGTVPADPEIVATPGTVNLTLAPGEAASVPILLAFNAAGDGGVAGFQLSSNQGWLSASPMSGTVPDTVDLQVSATGLTEGQYNAQLTITSPGLPTEIVTVNLAVSGDGSCWPIVCEQIRVALPFSLDFSADQGGLLSGNGIGTGFTYVSPTVTDSGYAPADIEIDLSNENLIINTAAGIQYLANNSAVNALGVGFAGPNQVASIQTRLVNPGAIQPSSNYEQAGLWFGIDQDHYVKLVYISNASNQLAIQMLAEVGGEQVYSATIPIGSALNPGNADYYFQLIVDPFDQQVTGLYSTNGNAFTVVGAYAAPPEFYSFDAAGIDPRVGTRSFAGLFATHRNSPVPVQFTFGEFSIEEVEQQELPTEFDWARSSHGVSLPTNLVWGPDNRLYVTELFGTVHALTYDNNLNVIQDQVINSLTNSLGPRMTLGITVDPDSTPDNVILWISHSSPSVNSGILNSGTVTRISGPNFQNVEHVITGLPRAIANHALNSLHFGPDGRLYMAVGGNTGSGSPVVVPTEFGNREEQPLSAAIIVADVKANNFDGACYSGGQNPLFGDPGCDVTTYATGMRNSYDFVFHSNGSMYATDNGLGVTGAYPDSATPPCAGFSSHQPWQSGGNNPGEQPDLLYRVEEGAYYGHPNPSRQECVFKDGSFQGVAALPTYQPPLLELGSHTSSNGMMEYQGDAYCGALAGNLFIVNYSAGDNVTMVDLSASGMSVDGVSIVIEDLTDPLAITQNPQGDVIIAEMGTGQVTALRPLNAGCNN